MTNASKPNLGALLRRGIGLALLALSAGCASHAPRNPYPLANSGQSIKNAQGVCVQIGAGTPTTGTGNCYQLAQPDLQHHVEPLPLDEFGYLFPPLKPESTLASTPPPAPSLKTTYTAQAAILVGVAPVTATPIPAARPPNTGAVHYTTKIVHFSTRMPFKLNSAHLSHRNEAALLAFVNSLEQYRGIESIRITGHTDKSGPARFNKWLSGMRARSARRWLLSLGVDPRTIQVRGVGSSQPRPHAHRAADNRYVDIEVVVRVPAR